MKKQLMNKCARGLACSLAVLILALSIAGSYSVPVYAATSTDIGLTKVLDMALTKTGISANSSLLQKLQASILNMLNGTASSYTDYCKANGYLKNAESWSNYLNSDAYLSLGFAIPNFFLQSGYFLDWMFGGNARGEVMESDVVQSMCDTAVAVQGEEYLISDKAVEYIRDEFDNVVENEGYGYYYLPTLSPDDVPTSIFKDSTSYSNFKTYVENSDYVTVLCITVYSEISNPNTSYYLFNNSKNVNVFYDGARFGFYYDDWYAYSGQWVRYYNSTQFSITTPEEFNSQVNYTNYTDFSGKFYHEIAGNGNYYMFATKDGRDIKIFRSLDALKNHTVGKQDYYRVVTNNYDTSTDNSVSFTGDYIKDNSNTYSYDIIQNEIDNSTEINESTVNNIVNNNTSTIVNNYYTTTDDGDDDGDGDGSGSGGGLSSENFNKLLDAITGLLDFIINLLGSVITLVTTFLNNALTLISALGESFSGVTGLLGDWFAFIPQEIIDLLCAGITLLVALAIYKGLKS